eukprot:SAG11_NODE_33929_length_274_cov_1.771429_1_plen_55_part_10
MYSSSTGRGRSMHTAARAATAAGGGLPMGPPGACGGRTEPSGLRMCSVLLEWRLL